MFTKKRIVILILVVILLWAGLALYSSKNRSLGIASVFPLADTLQAPTDKGIVLTFNKSLDSTNPYKEVRITPKTAGSVAVNDKTLTFTPDYQLRPNTKYTIVVVGAKHEETFFDSRPLSFTTGEQKMTFFEKELPYRSEDYSIDRLSDGSIVVTITSPPADENTKKALELLTSKGVDISKVLVQRAPSSR